jgi:hypothetical protein
MLMALTARGAYDAKETLVDVCCRCLHAVCWRCLHASGVSLASRSQSFTVVNSGAFILCLRCKYLMITGVVAVVADGSRFLSHRPAASGRGRLQT